MCKFNSGHIANNLQQFGAQFSSSIACLANDNGKHWYTFGFEYSVNCVLKLFASIVFFFFVYGWTYLFRHYYSVHLHSGCQISGWMPFTHTHDSTSQWRCVEFNLEFNSILHMSGSLEMYLNHLIWIGYHLQRYLLTLILCFVCCHLLWIMKFGGILSLASIDWKLNALCHFEQFSFIQMICEIKMY